MGMFGYMPRPDRNAVLLFLARILLSSIFVFGAFGTIQNFSEGAEELRTKHFPKAPWALGVAVTLEVMGAFSLISGVRPRLGASALVVFLVPVTLTYHNFWAYGGASRGSQVIHFLKNIAILGGLLVIIACPPKSFQEKNERK